MLQEKLEQESLAAQRRRAGIEFPYGNPPGESAGCESRLTPTVMSLESRDEALAGQIPRAQVLPHARTRAGQ